MSSIGSNPIPSAINARVAELEDALDLESNTVRCEGSSPSSRTVGKLAQVV